MLRVIHVPSHLTYVQQLAGPNFAPVPAPSGTPLRCAELLALLRWDWFDILHLHSVELCTLAELRSLLTRSRAECKPLVLTIHDLQPNIELDGPAYLTKLELALAAADALITLTPAARRELGRLTARPIVVAPHGSAFPLHLLTEPRRQEGHGVAAYGALRSNRDFASLAQAWQLTARHGRPPLRIWLRSISSADETRYADQLRTLRAIEAMESHFTLKIVPGFIEPPALLSWLRQSRVLALPYHSITHSGQL
ncbi:MAG: glycosyltransferase, partial [Angustibacter sp.]